MSRTTRKQSVLARREYLGLLGALAATMLGCGDAPRERVPLNAVCGAVTYQGQPIPGAVVTLHPVAAIDDVPAPRASVAADGSFAVSTFDTGDGAPEGDYVITVQWYKAIQQGNDAAPGPNVIPPKYSTASASDIRVHVGAGSNQLPPIRL